MVFEPLQPWPPPFQAKCKGSIVEQQSLLWPDPWFTQGSGSVVVKISQYGPSLPGAICKGDSAEHQLEPCPDPRTVQGSRSVLVKLFQSWPPSLQTKSKELMFLTLTEITSWKTWPPPDLWILRLFSPHVHYCGGLTNGLEVMLQPKLLLLSFVNSWGELWERLQQLLVKSEFILQWNQSGKTNECCLQREQLQLGVVNFGSNYLLDHPTGDISDIDLLVQSWAKINPSCILYLGLCKTRQVLYGNENSFIQQVPSMLQFNFLASSVWCKHFQRRSDIADVSAANGTHFQALLKKQSNWVIVMQLFIYQFSATWVVSVYCEQSSTILDAMDLSVEFWMSIYLARALCESNQIFFSHIITTELHGTLLSVERFWSTIHLGLIKTLVLPDCKVQNMNGFMLVGFELLFLSCNEVLGWFLCR